MGWIKWIHGKLRSILRKREHKRVRVRGLDHFRSPNRYFDDIGFFKLDQALKLENICLQQEVANNSLESRMREIRQSGLVGGAKQSNASFLPQSVNTPLLGMQKVASESSTRRFLGAMSDEESSQWMRSQLHEYHSTLLSVPWVLDVD